MDAPLPPTTAQRGKHVAHKELNSDDIFNSYFMIFNIRKIVNYFTVVAMILLDALVSCDNDDKRPKDDECICIHCNRYGEHIGNETISEEILKTLNFMMCPNPTYDVTYLMFKTTNLNTVTITDKKGKVLLEQSFDAQIETIAIDVSGYSTGEYRVTVYNSKQKSTLCLIKMDWD